MSGGWWMEAVDFEIFNGIATTLQGLFEGLMGVDR